VVGLVLVLLAGLLPLGLWSLRRYQHQHYAFGNEQTRFSVTPWQLYKLLLRGLPVVVLPLVVPAAGAAASAAVLGGNVRGPSGAMALSLVYALMMALVFLIFQAVVRPYLAARLQNLFWNGTRSQNLRMLSRLRARSLIALSLKNWLFVLLTLGLYLPFAAVATARLKLQAMSLLSKVDPDELQAGAAGGKEAAAGDAAGDLLGVDIGL
jgi:uncharacterized membrane protein YjgN (DUF898 family)